MIVFRCINVMLNLAHAHTHLIGLSVEYREDVTVVIGLCDLGTALAHKRLL